MIRTRFELANPLGDGLVAEALAFALRRGGQLGALPRCVQIVALR